MSAVSAVGSKAWASIVGAFKSAAGVQIESARRTPVATLAMPVDRWRDRSPINFPFGPFLRALTLKA